MASLKRMLVMTGPVRFSVIGKPAPQGSKKAFVISGRARLVETAGASHTEWRNQVSSAAIEAFVAYELCEPMFGPLIAQIDFRFPMPASRPKATRTIGWAWKTSSPDIDKLCRTTLDSLTAAALIRDDAQIVELHATKIETTGWTGATITLYPAPTNKD